MRESFSRSMTKHLVEEFTLNIMIKHTAQLAHAVPLIRLAYEFPLAPTREIDNIFDMLLRKSQAVQEVEPELNALNLQVLGGLNCVC